MLVSPMKRRSPSTETVGGATAVDETDVFSPETCFACAPRNSVLAAAGSVPDILDRSGPASDVVSGARD